ncbi:winged helix-turn-helix domain-containing protein [Mycobacterium sp. M1]|uniref:Winged helix-turn-helix domain-containing protein n=1 Tax=Mycolicibacter acidiphilus TaxID=2835306 RepID=A0ABS5RP60_9MYCO|nr:winged helix-turn-helix domain-containing protein [Mycolicibacter acidiphilus]
MRSVFGAAGHRIEIRCGGVLVDEAVRPVSLSGLAVLQVLAARRGNVVARDDLLQVLPGKTNSTHAVEAAVARLRTALGDKRIIATVVKRGYRLAVDEAR